MIREIKLPRDSLNILGISPPFRLIKSQIESDYNTNLPPLTGKPLLNDEPFNQQVDPVVVGGAVLVSRQQFGPSTQRRHRIDFNGSIPLGSNQRMVVYLL